MRRVYLDESGISAKERIAVVAGVIVDPDKQWKIIEGCIQALISEYVPKEHQDGFVFHATDMFHGSGKVFDRRWYPRDRSRQALRNLLLIPSTLRIPIVFGLNDKTETAKFEKPYTDKPRRIAALHQAFTYALCAIGAENYMRGYARPEEVAELLSENTEGAHKAIKAVHALLEGKDLDPGGDVDSLNFLKRLVFEHLPIRRIVDGVVFGSKKQAVPLQIADACAFIIRCLAEKKPSAEEFSDVFGYDLDDIMPSEEHKAGWILMPFDGPGAGI